MRAPVYRREPQAWLVWVVGFVLSLGVHAGSGVGLSWVRKQQQSRELLPIRVRLFRPPPRPRVRPRPRQEARPQPRPRVRPRPRPRVRKRPRPRPRIPRRVPPPPNQQVRQPPPQPTKAVFGVTQQTVGKGPGKGVVVRIGNTLMKDPEKRFTPPSQVRPYVAVAPLPPPRPRKPDFRPVPVFEVDENPQVLTKVRASYPEEARRRGIQGVVTLSVEIRRTGKVRRVRLISVRPDAAKGLGLGKAAVVALKRYLFRPARYKGNPVDIVVRYIYRFELED